VLSRTGDSCSPAHGGDIVNAILMLSDVTEPLLAYPREQADDLTNDHR
jgi:hypothetical protein